MCPWEELAARTVIFSVRPERTEKVKHKGVQKVPAFFDGKNYSWEFSCWSCRQRSSTRRLHAIWTLTRTDAYVQTSTEPNIFDLRTKFISFLISMQRTTLRTQPASNRVELKRLKHFSHEETLQRSNDLRACRRDCHLDCLEMRRNPRSLVR